MGDDAGTNSFWGRPDVFGRPRLEVANRFPSAAVPSGDWATSEETPKARSRGSKVDGFIVGTGERSKGCAASASVDNSLMAYVKVCATVRTLGEQLPCVVGSGFPISIGAAEKTGRRHFRPRQVQSAGSADQNAARPRLVSRSQRDSRQCCLDKTVVLLPILAHDSAVVSPAADVPWNSWHLPAQRRRYGVEEGVRGGGGLRNRPTDATWCRDSVRRQRSTGDAAGDDDNNYLADLKKHRFLGVIAGAHYYQGRNHYSLNVDMERRFLVVCR